MSKAAAIFGWARFLAPIILKRIPATAAIADDVATGMDEAEALHADGKISDKLGHVVNIGMAAGHAVNAEKPGTVDMRALQESMTGAIETAFDVARINAAHGVPAPAA